MSHYTMLYSYGKRTVNFGGVKILFYPIFIYFMGLFNKTIIPLALGIWNCYDQLIFDARSWDNCSLWSRIYNKT